jgi:DNA-directed RNA polymerase sigma subunit (sigma70/sigma32)
MYKDNLILIDKMTETLKEIKEEYELYNEHIRQSKERTLRLLNRPRLYERILRR